MLSGERGARIAHDLRFGVSDWPVVVRTVVMDATIGRLVTSGVDCVLNLAAGLDSRPYRLELPPDLLWIEADLPEILDHKSRLLASERPACRLQLVTADLSDRDARRGVLEMASGHTALVLTEGLLVYLAREAVDLLASDLRARGEIRWWLLDLAGPDAVRWGSRSPAGRQLARADAAHIFGPEEGPDFFRPLGWTPIEVTSSWQEARRLGRAPWLVRALQALTRPRDRARYRDLARVVLLGR
jgi:methyltransferase (TIGR00027 family)